MKLDFDKKYPKASYSLDLKNKFKKCPFCLREFKTGEIGNITVFCSLCEILFGFWDQKKEVDGRFLTVEKNVNNEVFISADRHQTQIYVLSNPMGTQRYKYSPIVVEEFVEFIEKTLPKLMILL